MGKNEECSPLSSYEINVNMLNEVGFKKDQGSSELLTYVKKKKGFNRNMAVVTNSRWRQGTIVSNTILQTFKWSALLTKNLYC